MNKREKIIAVVTAGVFLFWLYNFMTASHRKKKTVPGPAAPIASIPRESREKAAPGVPQQDPGFDWRAIMACAGMKVGASAAPLVRDPFDKLDYREVFTSTALDFSELVLSGIIWERSASVVLINNQILGPGETISGFKIDEIRQNEVVLIKGKETFILKLYTQPLNE